MLGGKNPLTKKLSKTKNTLLCRRMFFENYILIGIENYNFNILFALLSIDKSNKIFNSSLLYTTKNKKRPTFQQNVF